MPTIEEIFSNKSELHQILTNLPEPSFPALRKAFLESVEESVNGIERAAVLFSGGIDSSLIAKAISQRTPCTLFSAGLKSSSASSFSSRAAKLLHLPLESVSVKEHDLPSLLDKAGEVISSADFLQLQIAVPEFIAMKAVKESGFKHVFSGQGADELFFGYDQFRRELEKGASFERLEHLRQQKLLNLWKDNLSRDLAIAKHFSLELKAPFLSPQFIKQALAFPAKENILSGNDVLRKRVLRKLAEQLSLPLEIAQRRKKAIQYDSGLSKELKKLLGT